MTLRKAFLLGLLAYAISFGVSIIILTVLDIKPAAGDEIPRSAYILGMLAAVIITLICSVWYFKGEKASAEEGFKVGITLVLFGFLLDIVFFALTATTTPGAKEIFIEYYTNIYFWLTIALVIVTAAVVGHFKKKTITVVKKSAKKTKKK